MFNSVGFAVKKYQFFSLKNMVLVVSGDVSIHKAGSGQCFTFREGTALYK